MKKIRDMQAIVGLLENGEFNPALSQEVTNTLSQLADMSNDSAGRTFKGSTTIKLDYEVKDGMVVIRTDFNSKVPKRPRKSSMFWVVEDGALSTEHPRQHDLFAGKPRDLEATG
jgi:hypothetical protein